MECAGIEKELEESEFRWKFAIEGNKDGLWDWNTKTNTVFYSQQWKKMLGFEDHEIAHNFLQWQMRIHPDDLNRVFEDLQQCFDGKIEQFQNEHRIKCKDNQYKWIRSRGVIVARDGDGNPYRMIGTQTDITQLKQKDQIIQEQQRMLMVQSKILSISQLITDLSHHWRQPLTAIGLAIDGLKLRSSFGQIGSKEIEETSNSIHENLRRLTNTIDDIRKFIEGEYSYTEVNFSDVIHDLQLKFEPSLQQKSIQLLLNIESNIKLYSSKEALIEIFTALIENSFDVLDHCQCDSKYIYIDTHVQNESMILKFKDNAGGIEEDNLIKVFDPYFTTSHQSFGKGMGLNKVYNIITKHLKGSINLRNIEFSTENQKIQKGALFTIEIPFRSTAHLNVSKEKSL